MEKILTVLAQEESNSKPHIAGSFLKIPPRMNYIIPILQNVFISWHCLWGGCLEGHLGHQFSFCGRKGLPVSQRRGTGWVTAFLTTAKHMYMSGSVRAELSVQMSHLIGWKPDIFTCKEVVSFQDFSLFCSQKMNGITTFSISFVHLLSSRNLNILNWVRDGWCMKVSLLCRGLNSKLISSYNTITFSKKYSVQRYKILWFRGGIDASN